MKPLYWDSTDEHGQPYTYDSPNVTWDGILEPGDPGYVPPPPPFTPSSIRSQAVKHQAYYSTRRAEQVQWLDNFRLKLAAYAATLSLNADRVDSIIADARWLVYVLGPWVTAARAWGKSVTDACKEAEKGTGGLMTLPVFDPPPLPPADNALPAVTPRDEGALVRIFDLVAEIQENNACTDAMCSDLGIIGSLETGPDYGVLAPVIKVRINGNVIEIDWGWQGYRKYLEQCEIQVDRGTGWEFLTYDTTPGYTDTHPFPAALAAWKYRAIYRVDDNRVGQWSAVVSVNVGG